MGFSGTTTKCTAYDKTVHFIDLIKIDGISYHKTCFRCSRCNGRLVTRSPSRLAPLFSGTQDKCGVCNKTAYPLEKVFSCSLTPSSYVARDGILYCKHHFARLFMEKGCSIHLTRQYSLKKNSASFSPRAAKQSVHEFQPKEAVEAEEVSVEPVAQCQ
ncbi:hypothetical protein V6N11_010927 [Hibiscus sabdariffa]|uniref:LIM zinc-binding domain-containing protein n=1 Tax=Hibiscus sabdariffa TaxID=183260 RepID=A0ABR2S737_9ROSI